MRKIMAVFAAALIMLASATAAFAETINIRLTIDQENAAELAASFGVPEEQLQILRTAAALVNALDLNAAVMDDGGQVDLKLNGKEALSLGFRADEQGMTVMSTLFPNYAVTISQEALAQVMEGFAGSIPGAGGSGMNTAEMGAMQEIFAGYFTRFAEACSQAGVPGDPVPGEYEIDGYLFDTMVPVTVDTQSVAEATRSLMDEMLADEAVLSAIRSGMLYSGTEFNEDEFREGFEEWIRHFPDEASAEYYMNSEDGETFYITGQSSYTGKDTPSYEYTMLYDNGSTAMTFNGNEEPNMEMMFAYSDGTMNVSCSVEDMYLGFNFQNEGNRNFCELFFMDKENPLLTVAVTVNEDAERTLAMDTEGKTVLSAEELMTGSDAAGGFMGDVMTNGLGALITTVTEEVPEAGGLFSVMGGSNPDENEVPEEGDEQNTSQTRVLQLGTSVYTIEIPSGYREGELTEEEIRDDMVAYLRSPDTLLDFDVYQFSKEGYPEDLAEYAGQEAAEYESAFDVVTDLDINGIDAASYRAREIYDGQEYETLTYILDGGNEFVEVVFWLDGEEAEIQAQEIIGSLTFVTR